ncbi:hypothetical protein G7054_g657 [Neopestalotiopsis clavispora]|nr:hypothetical protein G7054_g657 [Neopestalotiopsis clavispora]
MVMASSRYSRPNSYCHECASVPRGKVAGTVNWPVPKWFGSLIVQFSVSFSLRRGLSYKFKAAQRVKHYTGDIFWCIEKGDTRQLHSLLKTCPAAVNDQVNVDGSLPLQFAMSYNRPDMITLLLENGADTAIENDDGVNPALSFAICVLNGEFPKTEHYALYGKLSTIDTLEDVPEFLGHGNVHKIVLGLLEMDLREYLESLEENERIEQIRHVDGHGQAPLHLAAFEDDAEAVETLLSFGADPDARNRRGCTPLALLATHSWSARSFNLLVERGASIHAKDEYGDSIVHVAAMCGSLPLMEQMYYSGIDIEGRNCKGATPLMLAALRNQVAIIERLLEWGADIEAKDRIGRTALFSAITQKAHQSLCFLLSKNANTWHVDDDGYTIWHQAAVGADARTMEILQSLEPTLEELVQRSKWNQTPFDILRETLRGRHEVWDIFVDLWEKANRSQEVTEEA